jgi:hypothetical protein
MNAIDVDDNRPVPLGQEANLDLITRPLAEALDILPPFQAGLALVAAGLDILPAAHCGQCYRDHLQLNRAELDSLRAESAN